MLKKIENEIRTTTRDVAQSISPRATHQTTPQTHRTTPRTRSEPTKTERKPKGTRCHMTKTEKKEKGARCHTQKEPHFCCFCFVSLQIFFRRPPLPPLYPNGKTNNKETVPIQTLTSSYMRGRGGLPHVGIAGGSGALSPPRALGNYLKLGHWSLRARTWNPH